MNSKISVLNRGFIEVIDAMGNDMSIVNAAKISYNRHFKKKELDNKDILLLKHMAKERHWTPFSHTSIQLHIKMPIFIARQWFKSQVGFTRNELSKRYTKEEAEYYTPIEFTPFRKDVASHLLSDVDMHFERSNKLYSKLIEAGVKPEQARIVLPQSMYTEFIETGNLASYARLYKLRIDKHAQLEIRQYAQVIDQTMAELYPVAWRALVK